MMEFSVSAGNLLKVCERVLGAVKTRDKVSPLLECFTVEALEDGTIRLFGTNNQISMLGWTNGTVKTTGFTMVKGKVLRNAVKSLPSADDVTIKLKKNTLLIQSGKISFELQKIDASTNQIPNLDNIDLSTEQIGHDLLRELIDRTIYACSTEETRYNLCGIFFEPTGTGGLRLVATDGHRLAVAEAQTGGVPQKFNGFIVPRKACAEIRKMLMGKDKIELGFDDKRIVVKSEANTILTCQLIDGKFPDYQQVVPSGSSGTLIVERKCMADALMRLKMINAKGFSGMAFELDATDVMTVRANDPELGEGSEELAVEWSTTTKGSLKIGFNHAYLIDACAVFDGEKLRIELTDALGPASISDPERQNQKAVIMPMRI